jgi:hypothetical protein
MKAALSIAAIAALLAVATFFSVGAWKEYQVPAKDLAAAAVNVRDATAELHGLVAQVRKDYRDPKDPTKGLYWDIAASLDASTAASRNTEEMLSDVRTALMGGRDTRGAQHAGVFPLFEGLIGDLRGTVADLRADLDRLTNSTDEALKPLRTVLEHTAALLDTLDRQIQAGSPKALETIAALTRAIDDTDRIIADPNITQILDHAARATEHVEGATESVDIAMRPWRKRASALKLVFEKLVGLFRLTHPI